MPKTAQEWQQHLGLADVPDVAFVTALNALEGQEWIDGGGLEAQGLTDESLTLEVLAATLRRSHEPR